jgi:hypothetical protein
MSVVAMSGNDTVVINNYTFADFASGDVAVLSFPNEIATLKVGKNGNSVYGLNESGKAADFKLRVVRASADDMFLQSLLTQQQQNFAGFVLMQGTFIKKIGDGASNITSDTYIVSGGVFVKQVEAKMNVEGDEQQSVSEYMMKFSNAPRVLT